MARFDQVGAAMEQTLRDFLTVSEAANFIGVSASTLRNWDRVGKVTARRHPVNGYRLYLRRDLVQLLRGVTSVSPSKRLGRGGGRGSAKVGTRAR